MIKNTLLFTLFYINIFFSQLNGDLIFPSNNSIINYVHVLFEWDQIPDTYEYRVQVSTASDFSEVVTDTTVSFLIYIDDNNIQWSSDYFWRIRPIYDQQGPWSEVNTFSTGQKRSEATAVLYNDQQYNMGLTIFGSFYNYYSALIDKNGNEVWNTGNNKIVYYSTTPYLDLLGCYSDPTLENNLRINFSIDSDFIWEEPNDEFLPYVLIKLPNETT